MKKIILSAMLLGSIVSVSAQTIYQANSNVLSNRTVTLNSFFLRFQGSSNFLHMTPAGSVGINTSTPTQALDVNGNVQALSGFFTRYVNDGATFPNSGEKTKASLALSAGKVVQVGTDLRTFQFHDIPLSNLTTEGSTILFNLNNRDDATRLRFQAVIDKWSEFTLYDGTQAKNFEVRDNGTGTISLIMPKANSFVGIGTTSFTDGADTYHLSVNGNIRADRVKVYTTWADFVFEEDYDLPTLDEVEAHIKEKGHLKDIPSACEVEERGIELGEMNKLLLQKIEELTLYMIDQKKENEKQDEIIRLLQEQVQELKGSK